MSASDRRQRAHQINIRVNDAELAEVLAKAGDLKLCIYARVALLGAAAVKPRRRFPPELRDLAKLVAEVNKLGSNVNQIARVYNARGADRPAELVAAMTEVQRVTRAIYTALGMPSA
jgi:hypothetical protein